MREAYLFCYHGTTKRDGVNIEQSIDLSKERYRTDFGKGFYVTNNLKQAKKWAIGRAKDEMVDGRLPAGTEPVVVYFHLDIKKLMSLTTKQFEQPPKEWAEFIFNCRSTGFKNELYHSFDYTLGPLADGRTNILVRKMLNGIITLDEFFDSIKPLYIKNSQLVLHTEAAIECLKIVGVKEIEMDWLYI
ncbi:DUF3990 domain-containing protein [Lysinibacillus sp. NPDC097162]|uniref:DUF3990 domain-containing protein n=1 Tax=Lysinibacillus sp. NPDC097162 TaxID=3364140 RepID=UPI00381F9A1B